MIQELFLSLVGHAGGQFRESPGRFELIDEDSLLSESERQLIAQLIQVGYQCARLDAYVAEVHEHYYGTLRCKGTGSVQESSPRVGSYLYGLTLSISRMLECYHKRVVALEYRAASEPSLPLSLIFSELEPEHRVLSVLDRFLSLIKVSGHRGGRLLDAIWHQAASQMGSERVRTCFWTILESSGQVFANQLIAWMVYGRLMDPYGEFFIERASTISSAEIHDNGFMLVSCDDLSDEIDAVAAQHEWHRLFAVHAERVPGVLISMAVARKVLFVGKAVRVLLRSRRWRPEDMTDCIERHSTTTALAEQVEALRGCFQCKSPGYVLERSVERICAHVSATLRRLLVDDAALAQHLLALKGFFLLGYGAFYQTFLDSARPLLQVAPSQHAELELLHGPWATAMGDHDQCPDIALSGGANSAASAVSAASLCPSMRPPLARLFGSRFSMRFIPLQTDFQTFQDATRKVKLVGMARLTSGHAELGLAAGPQLQATSSIQAMLWMASRQQLANGFENAFSFQIHAPPATQRSAEYGCRFALCFQSHCNPAAMQLSREPVSSQHRCQPAWWTAFGQCFALEVTYAVSALANQTPVARVELAFRIFRGRSTSSSYIQTDTVLKTLCKGSITLQAPRGSVHIIKVLYDTNQRQLSAFFGADAQEVLSTSQFGIHDVLPLDLGCAYVGFCLIPIEQAYTAQNADVGQVPSSSLCHNRPFSVVTWRHRAHADASTANQAASSVGAAVTGAIDMSEAWFPNMKLHFEVPWPLPLIITQDALDQYNRIFTLLISLRHIHLELQRLDLPRHLVQCWAFRAQLSFFITQVMQYFQQDVIEVAHQRLLLQVESCGDFDELTIAHQEFLDTLTTNCFLRTSEVHRSLAAVLRIVTGFCRSVEQCGWTNMVQGVGSVHALQQEFVITVHHILGVMTSMYREGLHAHLSQLLLRLDYNGFFGQQHGAS